MKFLFFNTPDNELVTIDPNKTTKVCKRNFLSTLFFFFSVHVFWLLFPGVSFFFLLRHCCCGSIALGRLNHDMAMS